MQKEQTPVKFLLVSLFRSCHDAGSRNRIKRRRKRLSKILRVDDVFVTKAGGKRLVQGTICFVHLRFDKLCYDRVGFLRLF